jgi:hypothetical protein
MQRVRSQLHLQMGQEVIYVLMTLGLMAALVMLASSFRTGEAAPSLPDCASPGRGPCISQIDLPKCTQPGLGPCLKTVEPLPPPPQRPPILNLTEREGFRFGTGSYVISEQFLAKLRAVIAPEILQLGKDYNANVVEVVGHTDSVPVRSPTSSLDRTDNVPVTNSSSPSGRTDSVPVPNSTSPVGRTDSIPLRNPTTSLDRKLNAYLSGEKTAVEVADNVGLGMMRAAAVVRALTDLPELRGRGFVFLAMSAGQTIAPDDRPIAYKSGAIVGDETRRRVEIRLRRSLHEP